MKKLITLSLALLFFGAMQAQQDINLTLRVDVSQLPSIDPNGISVGGTFNGFNPEPMNDDGNGIWSLTVTVEAGSTVLWKYINGQDFGNNTSIENVPSDCGEDDGFGGNNRVLIAPDQDEVLPAVCYSSCSECTDPGEFFDLTLIVDASELAMINPAGIHVGGTFNSFSPQPMNDDGNGQWSLTVSVEEGTEVQWKYINGPTFGDEVESVPGDCGTPDGFGGNNRVLTMPSQNTTNGPVCFGQCVPCDQAPEEFTLTLIVDASLIDVINPDGGIHVAGTFNGFSPTPMNDDGNGLYSISYEVAEGSTVLYKFLNSTDFSAAEEVPSDCGEDDGFGGFNRIFSMPSEDATVGPVCFGACVTCDLVPAEFTLTLIVDASELDQINPNGGIHVAGTFNGFSPTPMNDDGGGVYSISYEVTEGATVEYKFLNSPDFSAAEEVPEACGVPDGFEGFNRSLTMPSNDLTEGPVCFGECESCDFVVPCENPYPQVDINSITAETRPNGNIVWNWDFIPGQLGCRINVLVGNGPQQGTFIKLGPEVNEFIAPANQLVAFTTYSFRVQCGCSQQPFIVGPYTDYVPFFYNPGSAIIESENADAADDIVYTDNLTNLWQNLTYQEGLVIGGWTHAAEETTLHANPNPSNGQTFVTLSAHEYVTQGQIEVFDTSGRLVETLYSGTIPAQDELRLEFDGNDLPEGVYLIRFTTNNEVVTEKFILYR